MEAGWRRGGEWPWDGTLCSSPQWQGRGSGLASGTVLLAAFPMLLMTRLTPQHPTSSSHFWLLSRWGGHPAHRGTDEVAPRLLRLCRSPARIRCAAGEADGRLPAQLGTPALSSTEGRLTAGCIQSSVWPLRTTCFGGPRFGVLA